jgi:hypothetical protein
MRLGLVNSSQFDCTIYILQNNSTDQRITVKVEIEKEAVVTHFQVKYSAREFGKLCKSR